MTWLEGSVEVPFVAVAACVGLVTLATLVYLVRRQKPEE